MIKIWGTEASRAMRPIWTAEEMGIDYELEMMPFPPRMFMKEYLDINMLGTIPYLIAVSYTHLTLPTIRLV